MPRRRDVLLGAAACGMQAFAAPSRGVDEDAAFDAKTLAAALRGYGLDAVPALDPGPALQAQDLVEDGATVEVGLRGAHDGAQRLLLLIERNPNPMAARFDLADAVPPRLTLRVKLAQSSDLVLIALYPDGRAAAARRRVSVTIGGCGEGEVAAVLPDISLPPQPTRARVRVGPQGADVRMLMSHIMETGLRKDGAGAPVPAWFIRDLDVSLAGATVLRARWSTNVSRNPYLQFALRGAEAGQALEVGWVDTRGARRDDRFRIASPPPADMIQ